MYFSRFEIMCNASSDATKCESMFQAPDVAYDIVIKLISDFESHPGIVNKYLYSWL